MGWFELIPGLSVGEEIGCAVLIGICCMLAATSGLGGGPLYLSLLLGFGVEVHDAVPISKGIIFGGSIILTFINIFEKDPSDRRKPLVAWDMLNLIEPPAILGAVVGAFVNTALPTWFLLPAEMALLLYTLIHTSIDSAKIIKKERAAKKKAKESASSDAENAALIPKEDGALPVNGEDNDGALINQNDDFNSGIVTLPTDISEVPSAVTLNSANVDPIAQMEDEEMKETVQETLDSEEKGANLKSEEQEQNNNDNDNAENDSNNNELGEQKKKGPCCGVQSTRTCRKTFSKIPDPSLNDGVTTNGLITMVSHFRYIDKFRIIIFLCSFVLINGFTIARVYFKKCGAGFWSFSAAEVVVTVLNIVLAIYSFKRTIKSTDPRVHARLLVGSEKVNEIFTPKYYVKNTFVGLLAGLVAAVFGIGGGLLKQPMMLSLGVQPKIARGSSAVMILFTAITSFLAYVALGNIRWEYSLPMIFVSVVMFPAGYYLSDYIMHLIKSLSVIPITMALVMLISCVLLIPNFVNEVKRIVNEENGVLPGFNDIC